MVGCFRNELLFQCSIDKNDLLGAPLLSEMGRAISLIFFLVPFGGTTLVVFGSFCYVYGAVLFPSYSG